VVYTRNDTVDIQVSEKGKGKGKGGSRIAEVYSAVAGATIFVDGSVLAKEKLGTEITVEIYDNETGTLLDTQKIHTSCSRPLDEGMAFGGYLVVADVSKIIDLQDMVSLTGDVIGMLVQADEGLARTAIDDAISAGGDAKEIGRAEGEMTKAVDEFGKGKPDKAIDHYKKAWEHAQKAMKNILEPSDDLCAGHAKPQVLTVMYVGGGSDDSDHSQDAKKASVDPEEPISALTVHIIASDKKKVDDSKAKVWFEGDVNLGETFDIDAANAGEKHLKADTYVHISDASGILQTVKFHTSCSQPLSIGDQFGSLLLVGFIAEGEAPKAAPARLSSFGFAAPSPYPQPCNPEVWIPYALGDGVEVKISVHNTSGQLIRTLTLGYQPAGIYISKDKAAHWDGKNKAGEQVSSGVYFYTIQAGEFTATRKMVVTQ